MVVHLFCYDFCLSLLSCPSLLIIIIFPFYPHSALEFFQRFGDMERADPDNGEVLRQAIGSSGMGDGAIQGTPAHRRDRVRTMRTCKNLSACPLEPPRPLQERVCVL